MYNCNVKDMSVQLWICLNSLSLATHDPWLVSGDFNVVLSYKKKLSRASPAQYD